MMRRHGIVIAALLASLSASGARAQDDRACDYSEFIEMALSQGVAGDTANTHRASQPSGGFEGDLIADGPTGLFTDAVVTSCTVSFRRVNRHLIVSDGEGCAGVGATFMGVYTR